MRNCWSIARGLVRGSILWALLWAAPVHAESAEENTARALFREGLALHEAHQYAAALEKYRAAYAHWKNPKILANIGSAAWELGRFAEAARAYDAFLSDAPAGDPTRAEVQKGLGDVLPKVGTLDIRVTLGPAAITVDGQYVDGRPDRVRVEPGSHTVEAVRGGGARAKQQAEVAAGATVTVTLVLQAQGGAASAPRSAAPSSAGGPAEAGTHAASSPSVLPWVVGGVGVVAVATSGILFAMRSSAVSDLDHQCLDGVCPDSSQSTIDRAGQLGVLSAVTLGVGVVGIGASVYLLSTRPTDSSHRATALHLALAPSPTGASAVARLRF